jgi:hypothetical protein
MNYYVPYEVDVTPDDAEGDQAWKNKINEWAQSMWININGVYG